MSLGLRELGFVAEARLEDSGSGLAPVTEGWFVVNVRDAQWWFAESRGAACWFANEYGDPPVEFAQLGINVTVLEPGQSSVYHAESNQEAFLVLAGECRLLVEGEERRLGAWDFFHSPPWTEHAFVGAGDRPGSALPRVGARRALRRERRERDIRSGAGLCGGRAVPARAAAVLVTPAVGDHPALGEQFGRVADRVHECLVECSLPPP
jgi:quercetin dioxygenase-like cupin family protein